jgi:putative hydroxymethylpyrimidine transport system substrate-binding protein
LQGKTLGYKGSMPPQITAMLEAQGVDVSQVHEVGVGYDPTVLPRGQVQALTAYKSNEPVQLRDQGFKIREWDPDSYGIKGSFNVLVANPSFARAHPDAVEDFLRATFEAYQHCLGAAQVCAEDSAKLSPGYDVAQNVQRWGIESGLVNHSLLPGQGVGAQSVAQWQPEATLLLQDHLIKAKPELAALIDTQYVTAIYHGSRLIWPAP